MLKKKELQTLLIAFFLSTCVHAIIVFFHPRENIEPWQKTAVYPIRATIIKLPNDKSISPESKIKNNKSEKAEEDDAETIGAKKNTENKNRYYLQTEVDERATLATSLVDQEIIESTQSAGKIEIRLWINEKGTVDSIEIIHSDFPVETNAVILSEKNKILFLPAKIKKIPVKSISRYEIDFQPSSPLIRQETKGINNQ